MIGSPWIPPPEVRLLVDEARIIPELPAVVRARAMTRARAALVAGLTAAAIPPRATPWARRAVSTMLAVLACATAGVAAHAFQSKIARVGPGPNKASSSSLVVASAKTLTPSVNVRFEEVPVALAPIPPSQPSAADAFRAELRLLLAARDAVSRGDFSEALSRTGEHARRFKASRLVEEREVLRIRSLVGLGRAQEAVRAATAFRTRFPNSVLSAEVERLLAAVHP